MTAVRVVARQYWILPKYRSLHLELGNGYQRMGGEMGVVGIVVVRTAWVPWEYVVTNGHWCHQIGEMCLVGIDPMVIWQATRNQILWP